MSAENALAIIGPHKPKTIGKAPADKPLPLDEQTIDAGAGTITIDLTAFETRIDPPETGETAKPGRAIPWEKFTPLAASVALATLLGILAGTAGTVTLMAGKPSPAVAAIPDETLALRETVARLSADLAALRSGFDTANQTASAQLGKIGERLDRAEKAQMEPSARLAKIAESLDRLERRNMAAVASSADVTGSVTSIEKKPPALEGWRLREVHAGRALLESRTGALYEIGPGSTLPGVGKVETIKRVDGKYVITTPRGAFAAALEPPPRRLPYHLPPGY